MGKEFLTDEMVEIEIARLQASDAVKLAKKEQSIKYKRRQQMYQLRCVEKRGKQLMAEGITMDNIESKLFGEMEDLDNETN